MRFPFPTPPAAGQVLQVAEGILWLRIPLPYQLDHVNVWLIRDGAGWAVIDTGIQTPEAISAWEVLFAGPLRGFLLTRVIVTHYHPDHIGLAGWLCRRFNAPLLTSLSSYMASRATSVARDEGAVTRYFDFYQCHGMTAETAGVVAIMGQDYLRHVAPLPDTFQRLLMPDLLEIGSRSFRVLSCDGHAPEQILLYCDEEKLLFAADQVLEKITPNVSVSSEERDCDPLGHFLRSLRFLRAQIPDDVLVLPGHRRPFYGLHRRCAEFEAHHEERCDRIRRACARRPHSVDELVPLLFERALDPHQMGFAFTETLSHVNRLIRRGEIVSRTEGRRILHVPGPAARPTAG
ncbi:MBL fold metallo-hydrolase [Falsigemmobacter faecalis]|uniref:MBL fold metallo-hydrolase n=1 Tax=Falsigemmobacter faecalis TaxID=2488730 RepID=A0A3P3DPQ6_9RHOB|nr:MBL fold metallo-hydrolase [Falsigemmobacter faecalis]